MTPAVGHRKNSKGVLYGLCRDVDFDRKPLDTFRVLVLRSNYDGKVRGGLRQTWCVVAKGMEYPEARKLFEHRAK